MRTAYTVLLSLLAGCASTRTVTPREYLDEQTAATITVVADPWIFANERTAQGGERDFLNVYAIDVNRMGDHRQYLAVLQWWPESADAAVPILELTSQQQTVRLESVATDARELGIVQPLATSPPRTSKWWYFPVDKQTLATVAQPHEWLATLVIGDQRTSYIMWRDGRAELAEFADALQ